MTAAAGRRLRPGRAEAPTFVPPTRRGVWLLLALLAVAVLVGADLALPSGNISGTLAIAAFIAASGTRTRDTAAVGGVALVAAHLLFLHDQPSAAEMAVRSVTVGLSWPLAVWMVHERESRERKLAAVSRVAEVSQRAILAPVPPRLGSYALSAAYASAAGDALVGGDLYEVVPRPGAVRVLVGDVRGKGLDAVRLATVVLGEFRGAASAMDGLAEVALQMDQRIRPYLGPEDFVTVVLAELRENGTCTVLNCGHPPPLVARTTGLHEVDCDHGLPLGLGARGAATTLGLAPGDRVFFYTDGLVEARLRDGGFVPFDQVTAPLLDGDAGTALQRVLTGLHRATGDALGDDLAMLLAEFRPV